MRIHFIGIGGLGVSQVARFFNALREVLGGTLELTGSDIHWPNGNRIAKDLPIVVPHTQHIVDKNIALAIVSPVILNFNNPEVNKLKQLGIPIIEFSDILRFLRDKYITDQIQIEQEYHNPDIIPILKEFFDQFEFQHIEQAIKISNLFPLADFTPHPMKLIAVTGTDGKTTTAFITAHLLSKSGKKVGIISTTGVFIVDDGKKKKLEDTGLHQTTPPAPQLRKLLEVFKTHKTDVIILEITSHALSQLRITGLKFDVTVFTNITPEHLNYHKTFENYMLAKALLALRHTHPNSVVVYNLLDQGLRKTLKLIENKHALLPRHWSLLTTPKNSIPNLFQIIFEANPIYYGLEEIITNDDGSYTIHLQLPNKQGITFQSPILGKFNAINLLLALQAASVILAKDITQEQVSRITHEIINNLPKIFEDFKLPEGRLHVLSNNPLVIVDFAHTPNGLLNLLQTLKQIQKKRQGRIILVFGTAGERDPNKRPKMGKIAHEYADIVVLTAEDPRREDVKQINEAILKGMVDKIPPPLEATQDYYKYEINGKTVYSFIQNNTSNRYNAIQLAMQLAQPNDIVVITGKGHEQSLAFGTTEYPWNDIKATQGILRKDSQILA